MATNASRSATRTGPTSDSWMVFLVKVLLIATIILMLPKLVDGKSASALNKRHQRGERELTLMRQSCQEDTECNQLILEESMNCVLSCISERCFDQFYGDNRLEDGEIDVGRLRDFEKCVREERRQERIRQRNEAREKNRKVYNVK
jgi:hypothetical protein